MFVMRKSVRKKLIISSIVIAIILFAGILIYNYSQKGVLYSPNYSCLDFYGTNNKLDSSRFNVVFICMGFWTI